MFRHRNIGAQSRDPLAAAARRYRGVAKKQIRILTNALECLAPGGRLVYSTCSLEKAENEEVVERVLASRDFG